MARRSAYAFFVRHARSVRRAWWCIHKLRVEAEDALRARRAAARRRRRASIDYVASTLLQRRVAKRGARTGRRFRRLVTLAAAREQAWCSLHTARSSHSRSVEHVHVSRMLLVTARDALLSDISKHEHLMGFWRDVGRQVRQFGLRAHLRIAHAALMNFSENAGIEPQGVADDCALSADGSAAGTDEA